MSRMPARPTAVAAALVLTGCASLPAPDPALEVRWRIRGEPLVIRSEPRFAGAVSSLRFRGVEHLDSSDSGRLLQGAISFDGRGECLNPTQAGASSDGRRRSTSRLLAAEAGPAAYRTVTRMAYWLRPGQTCTGPRGPEPAANTARLSEVVYHHTIAPSEHPGALRHQIAFTTVQPRRSAVVEALTLYAPPAFTEAYLFQGGRLVPDPVPSPGEQDHPVVLATADGRHAVGFAAGSGDAPARFGRFRFGPTLKINVVFRPAGPYPPGPHAYAVTTVLGSLAEVETTLRDLGR